MKGEDSIDVYCFESYQLQGQVYSFKHLDLKVWSRNLSIGRPQFILLLGEHETQCWVSVRALAKGKVDCKGKLG